MKDLFTQRKEISKMLVERVHQLLEAGATGAEVKAFVGMMLDDQAALLAVEKFKALEAEKKPAAVKRTPEQVREAFCLLFGKEYVE